MAKVFKLLKNGQPFKEFDNKEGAVAFFFSERAEELSHIDEAKFILDANMDGELKLVEEEKAVKVYLLKSETTAYGVFSSVRKAAEYMASPDMLEDRDDAKDKERFIESWIEKFNNNGDYYYYLIELEVDNPKYFDC